MIPLSKQVPEPEIILHAVQLNATVTIGRCSHKIRATGHRIIAKINNDNSNDNITSKFDLL